MSFTCFVSDADFRCSQIPATFSATSAPSMWGRALTPVRSVGRRSPPRRASSSISTSTAVSNPLAVSGSFLIYSPDRPFLLIAPKSAASLDAVDTVTQHTHI